MKGAAKESKIYSGPWPLAKGVGHNPFFFFFFKSDGYGFKTTSRCEIPFEHVAKTLVQHYPFSKQELKGFTDLIRLSCCKVWQRRRHLINYVRIKKDAYTIAFSIRHLLCCSYLCASQNKVKNFRKHFFTLISKPFGFSFLRSAFSQ